MGPKPATKGRTRRTHSLGGCTTCRRRHVKCDQVQPLCLTCKAVGVPCEGYASNVQWVTSTSAEKSKIKKAEPNNTRRHLYSEQSRASMSSELIANLSSNSVDATLTEIDTWSRNNQATDKELAVGPFGVLNFAVSASKSGDGYVPFIEPTEPASTESTDELFPTPSTLDPLMSLDDSLQWADLFALDFSNEFLMQQDPFGPIVQDLALNITNSGSATVQDAQYGADAQATVAYSNNVAGLDTNVLLTPVSPLIDASVPCSNILDDLHTLLRHFQDSVIDALAGVPWTDKSPWKSLNLANAVQTMAELTYMGEANVKHASAANLYGIISISARHLAGFSGVSSAHPTTRWQEIADWALERAKVHLDQSICHEFQGPAKAKYKVQFMATMATMAASQLSGYQMDARRYLLETERILRLRGLAKREISRKARLMHHVYTWARIVGESTYVIHDYSSYVPAIQNLGLQHQARSYRHVESENVIEHEKHRVSHNTRLDDFLRLETQHDSDLDIDEPKEAEIGLHDIHLEDSRNYLASMYLQIYGIPETWLSLVSQTTRLANVMDILKVSNRETNAALQSALQKRASRLENMICSFAFKTTSTNSTPIISNGAPVDASAVLPNIHMLQALNSALVIFFYRRVRDVNPWILQSHVDDVIRALRDFDKALLDHQVPGPGTAWPAFIAGSEAIGPQRRDPLLQWIRAGLAKSGMITYKSAEEVLTEVWKRRDKTNKGPSPPTTRTSAGDGCSTKNVQKQWTWIDVCKDQNTWLMLY